MNLNAIEATLTRLREMAGPLGVAVHPEYGWFGFLDLMEGLSTGEDQPDTHACLTPSTVVSDRSPSETPVTGTARPTRPLYRHPHYHRERSRSPVSRSHHSPYYFRYHGENSPARRSIDHTRLRKGGKTLRKKDARQEVRTWGRAVLRAVA